MCRQFGHLGRDCQKRRPNVEAHIPNKVVVNNDGWSTVSVKHVFKSTYTVINRVERCREKNLSLCADREAELRGSWTGRI
mgnify:FL=1